MHVLPDQHHQDNRWLAGSGGGLMLLQPCLQRLSTTQSVSSAIRPHSSREHAHSSRQRQLACRAFGSEELAQDPQNTAPRPAEMEHEVPALSVREVEELIAAAEEELDFEIEAPQQYRRVSLQLLPINFGYLPEQA